MKTFFFFFLATGGKKSSQVLTLNPGWVWGFLPQKEGGGLKPEFVDPLQTGKIILNSDAPIALEDARRRMT